MTATSRPGNVVQVDGSDYQLWSLAQPSGWWAVPVGSRVQHNAVRLITRKNPRTAVMEWRLADD
jgi:hypothetical protein